MSVLSVYRGLQCMETSGGGRNHQGRIANGKERVMTVASGKPKMYGDTRDEQSKRSLFVDLREEE